MNNSAAIAEAYYTAMGQKNIPALEKYLHPDVQLISPLAKLQGQEVLQGKEAYLEALKNFMAFFNALSIRATFGEKDQALVIVDTECPSPVGKLPTAVLMTLQDGLITRIELFHDTSSFLKMKNELSA